MENDEIMKKRIEEVRELLKNPPKKRKDCKYYVRGKCDLLYRTYWAGVYPIDSRKYGWRWKCHDASLGRPCETYKSRKDGK